MAKEYKVLSVGFLYFFAGFFVHWRCSARVFFFQPSPVSNGPSSVNNGFTTLLVLVGICVWILKEMCSLRVVLRNLENYYC